MKTFSSLFIAFIIFCSCNNPSGNSIATKDSAQNGDDWAMLSFKKTDSVNPILRPGNNSFMDPITKQRNFWEEKDVFNPAIVVKDGKVFMLYRAQDKTGKPEGTSRIGLAESVDGIHFTRHAVPVLYPDNDAYKKYEREVAKIQGSWRMIKELIT